MQPPPSSTAPASANTGAYPAGAGLRPSVLRCWSLAVLAGACALLLYVASGAREIGTDDTSEFQRMAPRMELIHAPGYPLQLLIGGGFARLWPESLGGATKAMTLLSAVWTACAVALMTAAVFLATGRGWSAMIAGGSLAMCHTVWMHGSLAEAYALNNCLTALLIYLFAWSEHGPGRGWRGFLASALVIGIGLGNHLTILFFSPVILAAYWWRHPAIRRPTRILGAMLLGLAAVASIESVLVARFSTFPNHHMEATGRSALDFTLWWMSGGDSRSLLFMFGLGPLLRRVTMFAGYFCYQFASPAFALLCVGAWALRRRPVWMLLLVGMFAVQLAYALNFDSSDVYVFYQTCYVASAAAIGFGAAYLQQRIRVHQDRLLWLGVLLAVVIMPAIAYRVTPMVLDAAHITLSANKGNTYYLWPPKRAALDDWNAQAEAIAKAAPDGTLVLTNWNTYHLMLEYVDLAGRRDDIRVLVLPREGHAITGFSWAWAVQRELAQWPRGFVLGLGDVPELRADPAFQVLPAGGVFGYALSTCDTDGFVAFRHEYLGALRAAQKARGIRPADDGLLRARPFYDEAMRSQPVFALAHPDRVATPTP